MNKKVIKTRTSKIWEEDGILHCKLNPGIDVDLEDAKEIMNVSSLFRRGRSIPVLGDLSEVRSISHESREYLSGEEATSIASSLAIITGTPISKIIGNFLIGINKPPYPVKLFTSQEKAIKWLRTFVKNERRIEYEEFSE
jgi:hypothetical protein